MTNDPVRQADIERRLANMTKACRAAAPGRAQADLAGKRP